MSTSADFAPQDSRDVAANNERMCPVMHQLSLKTLASSTFHKLGEASIFAGLLLAAAAAQGQITYPPGSVASRDATLSATVQFNGGLVPGDYSAMIWHDTVPLGSSGTTIDGLAPSPVHAEVDPGDGTYLIGDLSFEPYFVAHADTRAIAFGAAAETMPSVSMQAEPGLHAGWNVESIANGDVAISIPFQLSSPATATLVNYYQFLALTCQNGAGTVTVSSHFHISQASTSYLFGDAGVSSVDCNPATWTFSDSGETATLPAGQYVAHFTYTTLSRAAVISPSHGDDDASVAFRATDQLVVFVRFNPSCPGDVNGDGHADETDLALILGAWGSAITDPGSAYTTDADLDGDGTIGSGDLALLLASWGAC
ncbi:MAG: dockerin type I repeat-containing protein [Phycisphaerae bacterium]